MDRWEVFRDFFPTTFRENVTEAMNLFFLIEKTVFFCNGCKSKPESDKFLFSDDKWKLWFKKIIKCGF